MSTAHFEPTPAWEHALDAPDCPGHRLLVVEDGERIAGWCRLFPSPSCDCAAGEGEVGIGLLPDYRGDGLGRSLLEQTLAWAAAQGLPQVTLTVHPGNERAIRLFQGCGFEKTDRALADCLQMVCQL